MKRYVPDFPEMMRLCEVNYMRLRRLVPERDSLGARTELIAGNSAYRIEVVDSTRYTTLVTIQQIAPKVSYWSMPSLTVRLYHDMRVAEVCSSQQIARFKARYDYPNKNLHQRDEKHQINQFLADWLKFCSRQGMVAGSIF